MEMTAVLEVVAIVLISVFSNIYSQDICPSHPLTLASVGDNITLCWQITAEVNTTELERFTVVALKRPVQFEMQGVASANENGAYIRTYERNHDGLYKDRVIVEADLRARKLFLRIRNYTREMENVYCVLYVMKVINDIQKCHADAVILRTKVAGSVLPPNNYASEPNSTETPKSPEGETDIRRGQDYQTELIIVSSLLGVFLVAMVSFVVWSKRRGVARKPPQVYNNGQTA